MAFTVFYTWQSDIDARLCRNLIHEALDEAAAWLQDELGVGIRVDQDTQDISGSPSMADTILEKIAGSRAVVADLTLTLAVSGSAELAGPILERRVEDVYEGSPHLEAGRVLEGSLRFGPGLSRVEGSRPTKPRSLPAFTASLRAI